MVLHEQQAEAAAKPVFIGVLLQDKDIVFGPPFAGHTRLKLLSWAVKGLNAVLYLFAPQDIDYTNNTVNGNYYDLERKCWLTGRFPFPDVVYYRNGPADLQAGEYVLLQRCIDENRIPKLNSVSAFNKWEIHRVLRRDPQIKPHLPETRLYRGRESTLMSMLNRYGQVYLKACNGRKGLQVMQITKLPRDQYEYCFFNRTLTCRKVPLHHLFQAIDQFFNGKDFIIQQPIDLLEIGGKKIDLRAEVQRNGKGQLEVVAVPVRVGQRKSPITTHATSFRFDHFFTRVLGYNRKALASLESRIHAFLYLVYETLEKEFGPFGEIGIDIGLDKNNKLWLIECNAQPAKVSLMKAYAGPTLMKAFTNPVEYALFLAGAQKKSQAGPE